MTLNCEGNPYAPHGPEETALALRYPLTFRALQAAGAGPTTCLATLMAYAPPRHGIGWRADAPGIRGEHRESYRRTLGRAFAARVEARALPHVTTAEERASEAERRRQAVAQK